MKQHRHDGDFSIEDILPPREPVMTPLSYKAKRGKQSVGAARSCWGQVDANGKDHTNDHGLDVLNEAIRNS
jgi:hypothetical protein